MTLTSAGLTTPRLADLRTSLRASLRTSLGDGVQLGQTRVLGRIVDAIAPILADIAGLTQALYDAFDPDAAEGEHLDNLCVIVGVTRIAADYSTGTITVAGTNGTLIPSGSIVRIPNGARFVTTANATIAGGDATIAIRAEDTGPVEADEDAISSIVTSVSGWTSITASTEISTAEGNLGRNVETDEELRVRREQSLSIIGGGTDAAIRARLLEVAGVDAAVVISNRTMTTDSNGIPPKAFEAVVWPAPADDDPVWLAIWLAQPAGIRAHGDEAGTAIDSQGNSQPVAYSVASEQVVHIDVLITADTNEWPADGEDQARAAVLSAFASMSIGDDVRLFKITSAVSGIAGIITITPRAKIGSAPGIGDTLNITITITQIATFAEGDIDITVTLV